MRLLKGLYGFPMIATRTRLTDADSLLQAAHREAYHLSEPDLIQYLKHR